ncbi:MULTISPECIES: Mov34/MPN/PAD-1 family protein [unclassified Roseofilum]|uniref:Mov34/MPN/PAD-1 family protein n=1 Tax=unclassified Roseofilum TaxID=2620099 RepID=UPI000E8B72E5|nr:MULTISPECIES: Mov34/MPN/PAD-1 family protein [unclassified Roseofilum]MBP0011198.1 Mov34/MPN/PAD-1 family protein [Roseofilum sp. Belize Diploria]MBP0035640.1 Mov34/MPN/PAD-1 family protein [Roseofilum sp. Belize BBD 4]HBQ99088.1 hypothetical protein [Cyanobacteria bacterium UBA11691]
MRTNLIPSVEVPAVKFISYNQKLYIQMNIKSLIQIQDNLLIKSLRIYRLRIHQGFWFSTNIDFDPKNTNQEISENTIPIEDIFDYTLHRSFVPEIKLIGDSPIIFHPHFTLGKFGLGKHGQWRDYYEGTFPEQDLGSYILRVARSLQYEEGYVQPDSPRVVNEEAAKWYKQNKRQLCPTDHIQFPSSKTFQITSTKNFNVQNQHKFQVTSSPQVTRKVKFEIQDSKPPYSPTERKKYDMPHVNSLKSDVRKNRADYSHDYICYLEMRAFDQIQRYISWGNKTLFNKVEQGGILLGHTFRDSDVNLTYAIIEQAIPGRLAKASPAYLEFTHETWKEMLDDVDRLDTDLQVIGWYHTHPNNLDVFMSGTDRATQKRMFGNDW